MAQTQTVQSSTPATERTYRIRMKPGCGKMLIARKWEKRDGTIADVVPLNAEDRMTPVDEWLLERGVDANGQPTEGPIAAVPESSIKRFLGANGNPSRVVDGYQMVKMHGDVAQDERTGELMPSRATYSPALNPGAFSDCTFEIVRD